MSTEDRQADVRSLIDICIQHIATHDRYDRLEALVGRVMKGVSQSTDEALRALRIRSPWEADAAAKDLGALQDAAQELQQLAADLERQAAELREAAERRST